MSRTRILEKVFADKKFVNGKIRFVVTPKLGNATLAENITREDLESALKAIDPSQT
jgi:3-dehydroquinate synthetase